MIIKIITLIINNSAIYTDKIFPSYLFIQTASYQLKGMIVQDKLNSKNWRIKSTKRQGDTLHHPTTTKKASTGYCIIHASSVSRSNHTHIIIPPDLS